MGLGLLMYGKERPNFIIYFCHLWDNCMRRSFRKAAYAAVCVFIANATNLKAERHLVKDMS